MACDTMPAQLSCCVADTGYLLHMRSPTRTGHAVTAAANAADGRNMTYEEYVVSNVLVPPNMTRTGFFPWSAIGGSAAITAAWPSGTSSQGIEQNMATPSSLDVANRRITPNPNNTWSFGWNNPGGGIVSTPRYASYRGFNQMVHMGIHFLADNPSFSFFRIIFFVWSFSFFFLFVCVLGGRGEGRYPDTYDAYVEPNARTLSALARFHIAV